MTEFLYFKTEFHLSKTLIGIETRGKKYDLRSHRYTLTCISLFIFQFILKDFHSIWFTSCCIHTFQLCMIYSNTNAKLSVWCQSVHSVFSIFMKTFWLILCFQKNVNVLIDHEKVTNQENTIEQCKLNALNSALNAWYV